MTLSLHFEGWFQCRMATDPDPTDEPRGVSGTAFALVTEPDFDRVIRFNDPVAPRLLGPDVGVRVTEVTVDGDSQASHPFVGGRVFLDGDPRFVEQNGAVVAANTAFIDPFRLRVAAPGTATVARSALWDEKLPGLSYFDVPADVLARRQVKKLEVNVDEVLASSGVGDPRAFVAERLEGLNAELGRATDQAAQAALQQRIDALHRADWQQTRLYLLLAARVTYDVGLNGPALVEPADALGRQVDFDADWCATFWMGAWDNDALCGYVKGQLLIPTSD